MWNFETRSDFHVFCLPLFQFCAVWRSVMMKHCREMMSKQLWLQVLFPLLIKSSTAVLMRTESFFWHLTSLSRCKWQVFWRLWYYRLRWYPGWKGYDSGYYLFQFLWMMEIENDDSSSLLFPVEQPKPGYISVEIVTNTLEGIQNGRAQEISWDMILFGNM